MDKKKIESQEGTIYYWMGGNQREDNLCIVFTHGMTADHTMFDKQVEYFSDKYKIITWDLPLHGESRPYDNFSYRNAARELKLILDTENLSSVILVGHSMGGYVCQEFAAQYGERIKAFVGVDTTPFGHSYYSKWERYILTMVGTILSWYPYRTLVKSIAKANTKTDYAYKNLYSSVSQLSKKEIVEITKIAYTDFLDKKETVKLDFPVLLIIGDSDNTGFVKKYNKKWSENEGYPLQIITNAAHASNTDNYDEFNRILEEFINQL